MINIDVKKGHYGKAIRFNVTRDGADVDFSGYTVNWKIWKQGEASVRWTISGSIIEAGVVDFTPTNTDFDVEGEFRAELEWTKTGIVDGSETFRVTVLPSL